MNESTARAPWWSHLLFVAIGLGLWFWTRNLIGEQHDVKGTIGDTVHVILRGHDSVAAACALYDGRLYRCRGLALCDDSGRPDRPMV